MSRRVATLSVALSLAGTLGLAGSQVRVPYVALGPGPLRNTLGADPSGQQLIVVPKERDHPARGELNLTTVNVFSELTLVDAVRKWFNADYAVVPRDLVFPKGQSDEEAEEETKQAMAESQEHAITAALCELGTPVTARIEIGGVTEGGPAAAAGLRKGDSLAEIDGRPVDSVCTLRRLTGLRKPGDTIRVTVRRGSDELTVDVKTSPTENADGRPLLGIELLEKERREPFEIRIAINDVGGPSAGLMFALGIYDRLTPGDLTGGRVIAGTGSIDDDGEVSPIGGIQQKLVAAKDHGAEWFLTPAGNYDDAMRVRPEGLNLVRIETLKDALDAIRAIAAGRRP